MSSRAVDRIVALASTDHGVARPRQVCSLDLSALVDAAFRRPEVAAAHASADLVVHAWWPLAWAHAAACVSPAELFWGLASASAQAGLRLFFLGAPLGGPARAERSVMRHCPGARVVGTYAPRLDRIDSLRERARVRDAVRAAAPDVLVVALGDAREDAWIAANKAALGVPVAVGLRDIFAGPR
jgi:N-acetylglucosaminyldiphosphoundecaprenol N-acetyl-beta-D-mannosaminyltransferase